MRAADLVALILGIICALIALPNFQPAREPVLYLYPPKVMNVEVKLQPDGAITDSKPTYIDKWDVTASPDGNLLTASQTFRKLIYEADIKLGALPSTGWTVKGDQLGEWCNKTLTDLGFIEPEIADFKAYWLKILAATQTWEIRLMPRDFVDQKLAVKINPMPDTFLRALFHFQPAKGGQPLAAPVMPKIERKGFTAVEWGGILNQ